MDGKYAELGYSDGMRLVWFSDTSVNPSGSHVFGNYDWHESADPAYWYYYQSGGENYPTTTGLSSKYVNRIYIYSNEAPPVSACCSLQRHPPIRERPADRPVHGCIDRFHHWLRMGLQQRWNNGQCCSKPPSSFAPAAGLYTVKLTVTEQGGSDDETKTNYITANEVITGTGQPHSAVPRCPVMHR